MGTMTLLQLFIWCVILVSIGQLFLIACYLWPRIYRVTHCPWCWKDAGIANDFPPPWSSTICSYHNRQIRAQARARRRLTSPLPAAPTTKPVAMVRQAAERELWV